MQIIWQVKFGTKCSKPCDWVSIAPLMILCWWKPRSNLNVFMSIYVTLYNFNGWYIKKYGFEIPSRDFKSIKINCNNGLKLFTRIRTPLMALCNENTNHFNGKCLVWRHQKGGKYLVSDVKYNRAITNY